MKNKIEFSAKIFFVSLVAATVLNGSVFWLKRVGWLDSQMHKTYYREYHHESLRGMSKGEIEELSKKVHEFTVELYRAEGIQVALKLAKDILIILFLSFSLWLSWKYGGSITDVKHSKLILFFLLFAAAAFINSAAKFGLILPVLGLRSVIFLFIALTGRWASRPECFDFLSKSMFGLIVIQALLVPIELKYGIHLFHAKFFGTELGDRVVGTMLLPSSLGIVSVFSLCFYYFFSGSRKMLGLFTAIIAAVVYFSASATTWLLFLLFLIYLSSAHLKFLTPRRIMAAGAACVVLVSSALPGLVGRPDVYESLLGRIRIFMEYLNSGTGSFQFLLGKGLGVGTNISSNAVTYYRELAGFGQGENMLLKAASDSTPMAFLHQSGVIGLFLFYSLLVVAAMKDRVASPLYLMIIVASITINITELFPVNIILGLLLARSFSIGSNDVPDRFADI